MPDAILVLDLGLTNCKSIVFSTDGTIIARATRPYDTHYPQAGFVEQDPAEWWSAVCIASTEIWNRHPQLLRQIEAIGVTGHMHAVVAVDGESRPVGRALILGDQRSTRTAEQITAELGLPAIYRTTGARMDASMPAAKIRWLRENAPVIYEKTCLFLGCKDYVRSLLTGDALTDPIDACATSLYDLQTGDWSPDLMKVVGVQQNQLPTITASTDRAGRLLEVPAAALGLPPGIPVIVGAGDDIEVLGNGLLSSGRSLEHLGTTGSILTVAAEPAHDPKMALELYPHAKEGLWVLGGSITAAGAAMAWASQLLGFESVDQALTTLVAPDKTPNEDGLLFLPHLLGERSPSWQPQSRGSWIGLTTIHKNNDLMRTALEGTVYALKRILDRIESLVGVQDLITVSGREYESEPWLRLRASIYERPLALLRSTEPTALGVTILACVAIGVFGSLDEAVGHLAGVERTIPPDADSMPKYRRCYGEYQRALQTLQSFWRSAEPAQSDD